MITASDIHYEPQPDASARVRVTGRYDLDRRSYTADATSEHLQLVSLALPDGREVRFRGKAGIVHEVGLRDRRVAAVVRRCQELPGQELFQYVDDDGVARDVTSDDVNDYLREISGGDFTAKDFRTWAGTLLAYRALRALQPQDVLLV